MAPSNNGWKPGQSGNPAGGPKGPRKKNLLSASYKAILGEVLDEDTKQEFNMPDGSTWADLIAKHVVKRAVGKVPDEKICFRAITELRETTEGKTPEKVIAAGSNEELANLARIMQGEPAPPEGEEAITDEDQATENAEADFHSSANEE
jgi:hypothetical protein